MLPSLDKCQAFFEWTCAQIVTQVPVFTIIWNSPLQESSKAVSFSLILEWQRKKLSCLGQYLVIVTAYEIEWIFVVMVCKLDTKVIRFFYCSFPRNQWNIIMLKTTGSVSRPGMCLAFNNGREGLKTCMQRGNKKNSNINCWWETVATGPCYHNRSLIGKVAPWAEEKTERKISRNLWWGVQFTPLVWRVLQSTGVLSYCFTCQLCIKGSQGVWPSAHKAELVTTCHSPSHLVLSL